MHSLPLIDAFGVAVRPPSRQKPYEWAADHVRPVDSARANRFSVDITPWLRAPMEACQDNRVHEILIRAPVGSGKTAMFEALTAWIIAEAPGPTLIAAQTDEDASDWAESRLHPMLQKCDPVVSLMPQDRHKIRKLEILFPHMPLFITGANLSGLQSKSMRWVLADEVWIWKAGMIEEARRRTHDRWNRKMLLVSQGGVEGDDFDESFNVASQYEFQYQCVSCGERMAWSFSNLLYDSDARLEDGSWDWSRVEGSVRYRCPCGHEYEDKPQDRRSLASSGEYVQVRAGMSDRKAYTYPALAVWWIPWHTLVKEWLSAVAAERRGDVTKLRQFLQKRLAQNWAEKVEVSEVQLVGTPYRKKDYHDGEQIPEERARFLTVDVQRDHFWVVCRAWALAGETSLLWEGRLETWEQIEYLQERYNVPPHWVLLDGRYETEEVAKQVARVAARSQLKDLRRCWKILMGDDSDGYPIRFRNRQYIRNYSQFQNRRTIRGVPYSFIKFSNLRAKDLLALLVAGKGPEFRVPVDVSEDYRAHMTAEHKIEWKPGKWRWEKIKKHYPNHLWDCEVMQVIAASIAGLLNPDIEESNAGD